MNNIRAYVDTSVFGGIFDDAFQKQSTIFFDQVKTLRFSLVTSAVVQAEMIDAPQNVKDFFDEILSFAEIVEVTEEALKLRDAYLAAGIVFYLFTFGGNQV